MDSDTVIAFDLDGTLTESKMDMSSDMSDLLRKLLKLYRVAIITGGTYEQIKDQVLFDLHVYDMTIKKLFLFPTSGSQCYRPTYDEETGLVEWVPEYKDDLTKDEKKRILKAFKQAVKELKWPTPELLFGSQLEDRATQITYSHFGQYAPIEVKSKWDPTGKKRHTMVERLQALLPDLEVRMGGTTSIDITKKGVDKAYGIRKMSEILNVPESKIVFVGDALHPGGNDSAVLKTGAKCYEMEDVSDTEQFIWRLLNHEL